MEENVGGGGTAVSNSRLGERSIMCELKRGWGHRCSGCKVRLVPSLSGAHLTSASIYFMYVCSQVDNDVVLRASYSDISPLYTTDQTSLNILFNSFSLSTQFDTYLYPWRRAPTLVCFQTRTKDVWSAGHGPPPDCKQLLSNCKRSSTNAMDHETCTDIQWLRVAVDNCWLVRSASNWKQDTYLEHIIHITI